MEMARCGQYREVSTSRSLKRLHTSRRYELNPPFTDNLQTRSSVGDILASWNFGRQSMRGPLGENSNVLSAGVIFRSR
jgi:hypothetical protein